ncbi:Gfo/Idh/MocA family oxidoreductase [Streptomyces sp. NPDC088116]|uniref:Gfo/Idh/MocA family oxidoreductase n=1 Tax=Streptomyces sp. NPDC088116 TaxID=3365825 RepID=UPI0037FCF628
MSRTHVCVVGHGVAGRLHERLLSRLGFTVTVVDPVTDALATGALPPGAPRYRRIADVPRDAPVDVWSVCSPTETHLRAVAEVLDRDPAARLLVEKPVCRSGEGPVLAALLRRYERARLVVMNQYRHAQAVPVLSAMKEEFAPGHPVSGVRVGFGKDRREDIAAGRFVDHDYGIFGYEWLHMLALVSGVLPAETYDRYLLTDPSRHDVRVAVDPELTSTAAHETTTLDDLTVELYSTIVGPDAHPLVPAPKWMPPPHEGAESRQRLVEITAGPVRFTLELDPVTLPGGTALQRNTHRLAVEGPDLRREWFFHDSPMDNALRWSVGVLLTEPGPPAVDLRPISRISRMAETARPREGLLPTAHSTATPSARL